MDGALRARPELPTGVRFLRDLTPSEARRIGDEASALGRLRADGLPVAETLVVSVVGADPRPRLLGAIHSVAGEGRRIVVSPLFPNRALSARFERRPGMKLDLSLGDDVEGAVAALVEALSARELRAALGGNLTGVAVRVVVAEDGPSGRAASADPVAGDPDEIRVWRSAANPWCVDRKTNRVTGRGEGGLTDGDASTVADLADRAQLVLGRPVEISFCTSRGRFCVSGVEPLAVRPAFTSAPFRIVTLIAPDEGTVAPLAIDALDRALREESADDLAVRRIYARPDRRTAPRRVDPMGASSAATADPVSIARASLRAARVASDVAAPLTASRRFERSARAHLAAMDTVDLGKLTDEELLDHVRERRQLAVEAYRLLDRGRAASLAVLTALEAAIGVVPRECYPALARPRTTRYRRQRHERLARMARKLTNEYGGIVGPRKLTPLGRKAWIELSEALATMRPLGIDVQPLPLGGDDERFEAALSAGYAEADEAGERNRKNAVRRLLATARGKSFGRAREGIVRSLVALLSRVASAKGRVADVLAAALLRLRAAAHEVGVRLEREGLLDDPDDTLYLDLAELEQAMLGEPGAYAARVRLRREDDLRWRCYEAPRRISVRRDATR